MGQPLRNGYNGARWPSRTPSGRAASASAAPPASRSVVIDDVETEFRENPLRVCCPEAPRRRVRDQRNDQPNDLLDWEAPAVEFDKVLVPAIDRGGRRNVARSSTDVGWRDRELPAIEREVLPAPRVVVGHLRIFPQAAASPVQVAPHAFPPGSSAPRIKSSSRSHISGLRGPNAAGRGEPSPKMVGAGGSRRRPGRRAGWWRTTRPGRPPNAGPWRGTSEQSGNFRYGSTVTVTATTGLDDAERPRRFRERRAAGVPIRGPR